MNFKTIDFYKFMVFWGAKVYSLDIIHLKITKTSSIKQEHDKQLIASLGYVSLLLLLYKKHKRW